MSFELFPVFIVKFEASPVVSKKYNARFCLFNDISKSSFSLKMRATEEEKAVDCSTNFEGFKNGFGFVFRQFEPPVLAFKLT